jgi:hypothetical protein
MPSPTPRKDPRVDVYIAKAQPFAQPILKHLRKVVHKACPDVQEEMKWSFPHFSYKGMFCGVAAFKQHCTFGFWKHGLLREHGLPNKDEEAMGQFGCIKTLKDLPSEATLVRLIKFAKKLNDDDVKAPKRAVTPVKDRVVKVPPVFMKAIKANKKAAATFDGFPYSKKKDYVEWVTEAKTDETRDKRIATSVEWLADGKGRNWKYEKS